MSVEEEALAVAAPMAAALGAEIRATRKAKDMTRGQLVERMPGDLHVQTIAGYESGLRSCTVTRLIEMCDAMDASPLALLSRALDRAGRGVPVPDHPALAAARTRVADAEMLLRLASSDLITAVAPPQ